MSTSTESTTAPASLMTVEDVCAYLRVGKTWVYAAADKGTLPSVRAGKLLRFRRADLEAWVERQVKASTEAVSANVEAR